MDYDSFCAICTVVCACTITICATIYRVIRKGNNFMTQAEKARAYDEAIKRAKEINSEQKAQPFDVMLKVFPELKESEDERIRKELIKYFSEGKEYLSLIPYNKEECVAWLEKQGKQNEIFNVPSREVILSIWDLGNEWKELTKGSISTEYGTQLDYIQKHWQESEYYLRAKQSEQKPYGQRAECLDCQFNYAGECKGSCAMKRDEQKLIEWSEEDERHKNTIIRAIHGAGNITPIDGELAEKWLKSLRLQKRWKPSEEQLDALREALSHIPDEYDTPILTEIYEQLKQL